MSVDVSDACRAHFLLNILRKSLTRPTSSAVLRLYSPSTSPTLHNVLESILNDHTTTSNSPHDSCGDIHRNQCLGVNSLPPECLPSDVVCSKMRWRRRRRRTSSRPDSGALIHPGRASSQSSPCSAFTGKATYLVTVSNASHPERQSIVLTGSARVETSTPTLTGFRRCQGVPTRSRC